MRHTLSSLQPLSQSQKQPNHNFATFFYLSSRRCCPPIMTRLQKGISEENQFVSQHVRNLNLQLLRRKLSAWNSRFSPRLTVYKFLFILGDVRFLKQPSTTLFFLDGEQRMSILRARDLHSLQHLNSAVILHSPTHTATNSILVLTKLRKLTLNFNSKTHLHPLSKLFPLVINTTKNPNKAGSGKY